MVAPLEQPTLDPDEKTREWLRKRARGSAHYVTGSGGHWRSPCGAVFTSRRWELIPSSGAIQCERCLQYSGEVAAQAAVAPNEATEAHVLSWLRGYYRQRGSGNGDRFAYTTHVRAGAGFDVRTADAIAMDLRKSKGLELHGHEVKVSRSDWKTELRDPEKWRDVGRYMDRWWIAIPDLAIVRSGELIPEWGLLLCSVNGVRVVKAAPKLTPEPVDRSFLAGLFRAAAKVAD